MSREVVEVVFDDDIPEDLLDMDTEESSWEFIKENPQDDPENLSNNPENLGANPENPRESVGHVSPHAALQSMLQGILQAVPPSEVNDGMPSSDVDGGMAVAGAMENKLHGGSYLVLNPNKLKVRVGMTERKIYLK